MSMDGISLSALVTELNSKLAGGRVDKIYQIDRHTVIVWIRQPGENLCLSISANPDNPRIHLIKNVPENPNTPPAFCMLLRKHLEAGRISQIVQHSLDRIVEIQIDVREEQGLIRTKTLVAELMGKHSNIILKHATLIIDAIKHVGTSMSRFRQVFPGLEYLYPPGQDRLNILTVPTESFLEEVIQEKTGVAAKAMISTAIGMGPVTAKEILWRAGLPENVRIDILDSADLESLSEAIKDVAASLRIATPTVVTDESNFIMAIAAFSLEHLAMEHFIHHTFDSMSEALEFAGTLAGNPRNVKKNTLSKIIAAEVSRLQRKEAALSDELNEANDAEVMRKYGDLLMAHIYTIVKGAMEAKLEDIYAENANEADVVIKLNPSLTPLENAQDYYMKYSKLKRAQKVIQTQLEQCKQEKAYLEGISVSLDHVSSDLEISEIRQELLAAGYIKEIAKKRSKQPSPSVPLTIEIDEGVIILVGKNNWQNDFVTFKQARSDDFWFHTQNIPGSHVILKAPEAIASAYLETAAQIAAYFSKARQSSNVPVDYTKKRYVKKPSGAKPGFVIYENQKTIYTTPDEQKIRSFLATQQ